MYDAIVVGARCAGSSTARLLAQRGLQVLIVDRATFPSDTVSTHCITPGGVIQLRRWGLLDRVLATNVPFVKDFMVTLNGMEFAPPGLPDESMGSTSPRRTVLDKLLLDAAVECGCESWEGVTVKELSCKDGAVVGIAGHGASGEAVDARAGLVIGADGVHSFVARSVQAEEYDERESRGAGFYAYFSEWPTNLVELAFNDQGGVGIFPTNDGQVCVFAGRSVDEFPDYKRDVEGTHRAIVESMSPRLAGSMRSSARESRFHGWTAVPGVFRRPFGPGWALVGDAGYYKDPVTGHGITDAFRDAELLANAVAGGLGGSEPLDEALLGYQRRRDEMSRDVYHATQDIAAFDGDPDVAAEAFARFGVAAAQETMEIAAFG
jgi:flavin-dependent dehydrogenase